MTYVVTEAIDHALAENHMNPEHQTDIPGETLIQWELITLNGGLGEFESTWDKLNAELFGSNPYYDSNFISPLLAHFATGEEVLCVHRNTTEIDGLLIIAPAGRFKWTLFCPSQAQILPVLVRDANCLFALLQQLPGLTLLLDLPSQDPLYSAISFGSSTTIEGPVPHAHTLNVTLTGSFSDYWKARPATLKSNVGRRMRHVENAGSRVELIRLDTPDEMPEAIRRFGDMESAGWKGRAGTAVRANSAQGNFYTEIMVRFARVGRACVYELRLDDEVAAMELCISSATMVVLLKTTYHEGYAQWGPGRMLLYKLLAREFAEQRATTVEFYTNADSDQLAWASNDRWIYHYTLFRGPKVRSLYLFGKWLRGKSNPT